MHNQEQICRMDVNLGTYIASVVFRVVYSGWLSEQLACYRTEQVESSLIGDWVTIRHRMSNI